ncbi:MAG TPA: hypothetical protein PLF96_13410, partial [Thermotogota bacterium]|nr:hypothetical protein [Thermotogota bacterium]
HDLNHAFSENAGIEPCSATGMRLSEVCPDLLRELFAVLEATPEETAFHRKGILLQGKRWDLVFQRFSTEFSVLFLHIPGKEQA